MRYLCTVSYKGTNYQGWQKQIAAPTIQGEIERVFSQILNTCINIQGSGRTDAGVHAQKQYFHFDYDKELVLDKFRYSVNCLLPKDILITDVKVVSDDFHARYSAKGKTYTYLIRFGERNAFNFEYEANIPQPVEIDFLIKALKMFEGKHDFKDFTSKEEDEDNFVREIYSVETTYIEQAKQFFVTFKGNGFMRYMIRNMVGASIAVASGKEDLSFISYHLSNKEKREIISYKASPEGLYLVDVNY